MYRVSTLLLTVFLLLGLSAAETLGQEPGKEETQPGQQKENEEIPDAQAIVNKANLIAYYQGDNGKSHVKMTITTYSDMQEKKVKSTRLREFNILRRDVADGGDQKYYVYFQKPADVRKMVFMVHKHVDAKKDDDRWLYLPSLDLVKRIAASDKRTSFVGSDFLYEDVSGRSLKEDKHKLAKITADHFVIKNVPLDPKTVQFNYYNVWIDRKSYMPVKMEFFDTKDRLYRRIEALEIETIQNFPTVLKSMVTDLNKKSTTVMEFSKIKYDIKLKDIFTERYLRKPPREAIR